MVLHTSISHSGLRATISHKGAELIALHDATRQYLWNGDPAFWGKHSPVLFPIVGTLKDNRYVFESSAYSLSRHGFARDLEFELLDKSIDRAVFVLQANPDTRAVYPFEFELRLTYSIDASGLRIDYMVRNKSNQRMPFSLGAHPAFALPLGVDRYALRFDGVSALRYHLLDGDLLAEKTDSIALDQHRLPLHDGLFAYDALVFLDVPGKTATLLEDDKPVLTVDYHRFPDLGLWKKTGANFLCIEPWHGYADPVNASGNLIEKPGIIRLEPHGNFETYFKITVHGGQ